MVDATTFVDPIAFSQTYEPHSNMLFDVHSKSDGPTEFKYLWGYHTKISRKVTLTYNTYFFKFPACTFCSNESQWDEICWRQLQIIGLIFRDLQELE